VWILTADDVRLAKTNVLQRRRSIEQELKVIDAELAELEEIERSAKAFVEKYHLVSVAEFNNSKPDDFAEVGVQDLPKIPRTPANSDGSVTNWGSTHLISACGTGS
jgi:hypothetical protein